MLLLEEQKELLMNLNRQPCSDDVSGCGVALDVIPATSLKPRGTT
jgi:hypothetical protein